MATAQTRSSRVRKALFAVTALWPVAAFGQSMDSTAQMIMNSLHQQVPNGECGEGPCTTQGLIPITAQPGDVMLSGSLPPDSSGNVWSLQPNSCQTNGPGTWWSGLYLNGAQFQCGYIASLRMTSDGHVWTQEAKGSGWKDITAALADGNMNDGLGGPYVSNPGPGVAGGGQAGSAPIVSGSASDQATSSDPPPFPSAQGQSCPAPSPVAGAVTPGSGSFQANGATYSINATAGDVASINGAPINQGAYGTSQLTQGSDGSIYGQDENSGQWFLLQGTGGDTWWQPLASLPSSGQSPVATARWETAASGGQQACATAPAQSASGAPNQASGVLPDLMQICAASATTANPTNAALCAEAAKAQAQLSQVSAELAAAQQNSGASGQ